MTPDWIGAAVALVGVPAAFYWVEVIGDPGNTQKGDPARKRLWGYIHDYGYDGVERLLQGFGYRIRPSEGPP